MPYGSFFHQSFTSFLRKSRLPTSIKKSMCLEGVGNCEPEKARKVDCELYKYVLYYLEVRQVFLDPKLSLKKLSNMIETNQTYLSNVVNRYFGCHLKELVNTYRVEYAKELLRSNKCSLDKVPEKSGFTSRIAFYSAFSKIAGESPKRYFLHEQRDLCAQSITNMYNQF